MRKEGTIVRWDEAKGFGFIRSAAIVQDVFIHVRDYRFSNGQSPRAGLRVTFEHIHVGGKGPRAMAVQPLADAAAAPTRSTSARAKTRSPVTHRATRTSSSGAWWALPLMAAYAAALALLVRQGQVPGWVVPASVFVNLATFLAYWHDKQAAQAGRWRVKEGTLHLWSLAGGWGGAWLAQQALRHKSAKPGFLVVYRATVVLHCAALAAAWWWFLRAA